MINNTLRNGNFSSSKIAALLSMGSRDMTPDELKAWKDKNPKSQAKKTECWPGKAALTYIRQKNMERRAGQSIDREVNAKPLNWGKLVEGCVHQLLPIDYTFNSSDTHAHPIIPWWVGSRDGGKNDTGGTTTDIKSPMTLESFCNLVDGLYKGLSGWDAMMYARENHSEGDTYYWQLVSNSCIHNTKYVELIVYMPFLSELDAIRRAAHIAIEKDPFAYIKYNWIAMGLDEDLPFLLDGGFYNNLNIIRFEVPEADKELLTRRVLQAGKLLENNPDALMFEIPIEDYREIVSFLKAA
jgi:hypothetical protein